jgi:hypothetical protein
LVSGLADKSRFPIAIAIPIPIPKTTARRNGLAVGLGVLKSRFAILHDTYFADLL